MWLWRRIRATAVVLALGLVSCAGFKESMEDRKRATSALKSELGFDAEVSFRTMNGRTSVAVRLAKPPSGDAAATKGQITEVVNRTFHNKVERVDVSF